MTIDIIGLIAAACISSDAIKVSECKATINKCIVDEVSDPEDSTKINKCIEKGKSKLKTFESQVAKITKTPDSEVVKYISYCNNLILEELTKKVKRKPTIEEVAQRYFDIMNCDNIARGLQLLNKDT